MKILLVDDDSLSRGSLHKFLTQYLHHEVAAFDSAVSAYSYLDSESVDMIISDIKMPEMSGIELLEKVKSNEELKHIDLILITGFGEVSTAIQALRLGAYDYLQKPVDIDELANIISRIEEKLKLIEENRSLSKNLELKTEEVKQTSSSLNRYQSIYREIFGLGKVGFYSQKMQEVERLIEIYHHDRDVNVLITGETGTGKEVAARMVHYKDGEELRPFITVNCSAISPSLFESELFGYEEGSFTGAKSKGKEGKFDLAQGGTIFFDEIGDMPLDMQPKLLRVLQMKEFYRIGGSKPITLDVRVTSATNRDLAKMVADGSFRRDLLFRLNTGELEIPPLRERKDAIVKLAQLFLQDFSIKKNKRFQKIDEEAKTILKNYEWKGNIRELKNIIERTVLLHDETIITPIHLTKMMDVEYNETIDDETLKIKLQDGSFDYKDLEKEIMIKLLSHFKGNKSQTAKYLNITRNRLNRKLV